VGNVFSEIEKRFKIQFTDRQLQELIYFICFVLHRIDSGKVWSISRAATLTLLAAENIH
jgi:transcriptional antiterminator